MHAYFKICNRPFGKYTDHVSDKIIQYVNVVDALFGNEEIQVCTKERMSSKAFIVWKDCKIVWETVNNSRIKLQLMDK